VLNRKLALKNREVLEDTSWHPIESSTIPETAPRNDSGSVINPVVEMRDVTVRYGETTVIDNINWVINKGEHWALAGKNGSGKTTLFSLIYADHPMAYSQQVYLFGRRRGTGESIWDIKNRIAYVGPEQVSFLDPNDKQLTAQAYILRNPQEDSKEFQSLIEFFDANELLDRPLGRMSSGEIQLVFIIKSLLHTKELLLLDEPFRFLDPSRKEKLNQYLHLHLDGETTLVLITHDEEDLQRWGEKVLFL